MYFIAILSLCFLSIVNPQIHSIEPMHPIHFQQNSEILENLAQRYISFINTIGSGKEIQESPSTNLFSENCKKDFNGRYVALDRETFEADLHAVYKNYGGWELIPLEIFTCKERGSIILHINILATNLGKNTAIVILRVDENNLITEIIEVFSPVQDVYDFS